MFGKPRNPFRRHPPLKIAEAHPDAALFSILVAGKNVYFLLTFRAVLYTAVTDPWHLSR